MLSVLNQLWSWVDPQHTAVAIAAVWLWHHILGSKADSLEQRITEVARIAYQGAALLGTTGDALLAKARELAKAQLDKLGFPALTAAAMALLDHELNLVATEQLPAQIDALNKQLATLPAQLDAIHAKAFAAGKTFADEHVETVPFETTTTAPAPPRDPLPTPSP